MHIHIHIFIIITRVQPCLPSLLHSKPPLCLCVSLGTPSSFLTDFFLYHTPSPPSLISPLHQSDSFIMNIGSGHSKISLFYELISEILQWVSRLYVIWFSRTSSVLILFLSPTAVTVASVMFSKHSAPPPSLRYPQIISSLSSDLFSHLVRKVFSEHII